MAGLIRTPIDNWGSLVLPRKLMVAQADLNFGRSEQGF
ncbi:hypothetical protein ACVW0B_001633 [Thermostichus sp. MS-CIW-23]